MKQNETNIHLSVKEVQFRKNPRFLHWRFLFYQEKITRKKTVLNLDVSMKIEWFRKVCCITVFEKSISLEYPEKEGIRALLSLIILTDLALALWLTQCRCLFVIFFVGFSKWHFLKFFFLYFEIKFWLNPFFNTNVFNVAIQKETRKKDYLHNLQINMKIWIKIKREIL